VRKSNQVARDLYKKLGYVDYRKVLQYYSGSDDEEGEDAYGAGPSLHPPRTPSSVPAPAPRKRPPARPGRAAFLARPLLRGARWEHRFARPRFDVCALLWRGHRHAESNVAGPGQTKRSAPGTGHTPLRTTVHAVIYRRCAQTRRVRNEPVCVCPFCDVFLSFIQISEQK